MRKYIYVILTFLIVTSCRKDNPIKEWFQDPPVEPVTKVIKTTVPIGYAASLVTMDMKGLKTNVFKSEKVKNANLLYVDTETNYPYQFKDDNYGEMLVAYVQTDENTALVSVFFTDMDVSVGSFKLENIIAFPIIYDPVSDKTTAVYVSMDINIDSYADYGLDLTSSEINESLNKLNNERIYNTSNTDVAVAQNAWIIDVYHNGTFNDLYDDEFNIFGGQQAVSVENFDTESSAGALQMAMIDVEFSSDCIKNPSHGYVFMQDVEVATSDNDNDIVFGHVLYEFHQLCDGDILVDVATGNFLFAIGKELDLNLY